MKEKWVRINTIEGYEEIKDCYWLSNSDDDKIINKDTRKIIKGGFDENGYKRVGLRTIDGRRTCRIHVLKAKAFLFGPNPLGAYQIRHLNDVKTDNKLINLAWGTRSDNMQDCIRNGNYNHEATIRGGKIGGKINGAKNGKKGAEKSSKSVRCLETGIIYPSCIEAERQTGIHNANISHCCNGKCKTAKGLHWEFVNKEEVK